MIETGLVYFRQRFFDPETGTFISDDPQLYTDGPNSRQFALNSPFVLADPLGTTVYGYVTARIKGRKGRAGFTQFDPIDPPALLGDSYGPSDVQSEGQFAANIARASASGRLVTFVHGYNVEVGGFRQSLGSVDAGFNSAGRPQPLYGFTWKGDPFGRPASAPFFGLAERNANLTGYAFVRYLMKARRYGGNSKQFAISHSLGARVALRGLQFLSTLRRSFHNTGAHSNLDGLFMFNAAVKAKTVVAGGSLASGLANVNTVRNFFGENDPVLGGVYRLWATGKRALGSRPLEDKISPLARNYLDMDMMDPAIAGSPACTHSKHLHPGDWGYGRSGTVTGDPRCYGAGFEHSQLYWTLAAEIQKASSP